MADPVKLFSAEWCQQATQLWEELVVPDLIDPEAFNYVIQFNVADDSAMCQLKAERGHAVAWEPGTPFPDAETQFIVAATPENWRKLGEGTLDPMAAIPSKRMHFRRGPVAVAIKEIQAFKKIIPAIMAFPIDWDAA